MKRVEICPGVHFMHIPDSKFKRNLITVSFVTPLDAKTASDNAIVPYILRKGFRECPDFSALNARLNELYGASMDTSVTKINGYQILSVSIRGVDNRFALENEDITGECAALLLAAVSDPKISPDGFFDAKDTELEKQFILDSIESEINDKRQYATIRCVQEMCKGESMAVRRLGSPETAAAITPESAYSAYNRLLGTAGVEIIFTGSGNPDKTAEIFKAAFSKIKRNPEPVSLAKLRTVADNVNNITETMPVNQAKLVMGFRTGDMADDSYLCAMRVCSALFGGTPFSKLFMNVREKLSLCYYCSSNFDIFSGIMLVSSGVESANKQQAQDEILRQLDAVRDGDFTDEELENTKLLVRNSLTSALDSPGGMESWYMGQVMHGSSRSPLEEADMLDRVTREQIIEAAKKVTLDTVYFLTGNGEEEKGEGE